MLDFGTTTTCTAMLLPASERYSTVAFAPTASLPSTLVSSSTRNLTMFTSLPFATSRANAASPIDAILPESDWFSGVGCGSQGASRSGTGADQAATVKQARNRVVRQSAVRNRIVFPPIRFWTGNYNWWHEASQSGWKIHREH